VWVDEADYERALSCPEVARPKVPVTFRRDGRTFCALALPEGALPLRLPEVTSYQPTGNGESPLAAIPDWIDVWYHPVTGEAAPASGPRPEGPLWIRAKRESNTMPQWPDHAGTICATSTRGIVRHQRSEAPRLLGVPDLYVGGAEHAVLHLLYARFWHMFLHDLGVVREPEPFRKLFHQGSSWARTARKCPRAGATWPIPIPSSANMAPMPCASI